MLQQVQQYFVAQFIRGVCLKIFLELIKILNDAASLFFLGETYKVLVLVEVKYLRHFVFDTKVEFPILQNFDVLAGKFITLFGKYIIFF